VGESPIPDEVDYLIVGSGAGGATMAYRLACNSASVLVIERGPRYSAIQDFNDNELEMVRKLYKEGGLQQTKRFDLTILQGECVGGSTVINNAICFRMPEPVQKRWTDDFGLNLTELKQEYNAVGGELEIAALDPIAVNTRVEAAFRAGVAGYNAGAPGGALLGRRYCKATSATNWAPGSLISATATSESAPCWRRTFRGRRHAAPPRSGTSARSGSWRRAGAPLA
jgi:choline dehydrogenase-like flavoprotein